MRSFAYTQIKIFYLRGYGIRSEIKESESNNSYWEYFCKVYPCSNFFEELRYAVSRATNEISISSLQLSSKEFIQLVKAVKKVNALIFKNCKISLESEFDFSLMDECLIEKIYVGFNSQVYDEWSEHEECLMNIFLGILSCENLIRSLKDINFGYIYGFKEKLNEKAKEKLGEKYLKIMPSLKRL